MLNHDKKIEKKKMEDLKMNYYKIVDLNNKVLFNIGKVYEAKLYLPFFANLYNEKEVILFGDESHENLDDKYKLIEYGGEYKEGSIDDFHIDMEELDEICMSYREFYTIFEKIGGCLTSELNQYIRFKYKEN